MSPSQDKCDCIKQLSAVALVIAQYIYIYVCIISSK